MYSTKQQDAITQAEIELMKRGSRRSQIRLRGNLPTLDNPRWITGTRIAPGSRNIA